MPTSLIITYHGKLGSFGAAKNIAESISVYLCDIPVVLNVDSLKKARKLNSRAQLISAFIPPKEESSNLDIAARIMKFSRPYQSIFCTNAFSVAFDNNSNEIYRITDLIRMFKKLPEACLIFSDPSGSYIQHLEKIECTPGVNILVLTGEHSFVDVIKCCDVVIRSTTTDGDSLTVKESLYFGKQVIASDCVSRPKGTLLFRTNDMKDLLRQCKFCMSQRNQLVRKQVVPESSFPKLLRLYSGSTKKK